MAASTIATHVTLDAFYEMSDVPDGAELADGEIVPMTSPSADHGFLSTALFLAMHAHASAHRLGRCFTDGFGYELPVPSRPNTLRIPDASFVRTERMPRPRPRRRSFALAPDVAVEVRSPSDVRGVLQAKLADYMDSGTGAVWVVDDETRTVEVHTPGVPVRVLREADTLDGGAALPGFTFPLAQLFAELND